jgi:hypothetical protein
MAPIQGGGGGRGGGGVQGLGRSAKKRRWKRRGILCTSDGEGDLDLLLTRLFFMLATYSAVRRGTKRKKEIQGTQHSSCQHETTRSSPPGCSDGAVWVLASNRDISEKTRQEEVL